MNFAFTSRVRNNQKAFARTTLAGLTVLGLVGFCPAADAADKPPLAPDIVAPFSTNSRLSASIEFSLPALAADIERDIPQRLASIDEKISCVHRRVLFWKVNANCDVWGYVERSGPVSLYGRGDRVYGSVPIHGALEGQGANRFTARIHGETEASATIEASARPQLGRDWSLDLDFSDGFRWSEPPVLQVMGHEFRWRNMPSLASGRSWRWSVHAPWPRRATSNCRKRQQEHGDTRSSRSSYRIVRRYGCR